MTGHGQKFGRKKEEAIAALLSQRNLEEAARVAGVGTKTLLRWLEIPEFQAAYREARRAAFGHPNVAANVYADVCSAERTPARIATDIT